MRPENRNITSQQTVSNIYFYAAKFVFMSSTKTY